MPAKLYLPETAIVDRWLLNINTTTRSIAIEFGCSPTNVSSILRRHLSADTIDNAKRSKMSASCAARPDLKTKEHSERAKYANSCVTPEGKEAQRAGLLRGAVVSANNRTGKKFTEEHKAKLSEAHIGIQSKEKHPNWRGGTSEICWRGTGWTKARKNVRIRDNNTCRICGKTAEQQGRNMDVHHRVSYFNFTSVDQANSLDNLVCLCRSCHRSVENGKTPCP